MIEPPKVPAQYSADSMAIAGIGSSPMVNGSSSATAMGELNPGRAPTTTPINTPQKMRKKLKGSRISPSPWNIASTGRSYWIAGPKAPGSK